MDNQRNGQALAAATENAQYSGPVEGSAEGAKRTSTLWMLGLALLAFAVRAQGLFADFIFDDVVTFQQRTKASWAHIPAYFSSDQSALFGSNFYRPVLNTWYELFFSLFGVHAAAWHGLSILLHVACTLLVFRLGLVIIERPFAAGVAAALFAVHPAHVEAISWASAVADPLWTMLMLVSVLAFLRWMERGSAGWLTASLLAGAASIFSKETAVVMPVVLLATALALRGRFRREIPVLVAATAPLFASAVLFLLMRRSVLHGFSHAITVATDAQMVLTWPAAMLFYLRHMIWPGIVVPFYPLRIVQHWNSTEFWLPLLGVTAAGAVLVYLLWRAAGWRKTFLCLAWTLVPLAPAFYLKALAPFELVHDRFLYAPLIGFCMAAALVLQWAAERIEAVTQFRIFVIVTIALIPLLALESVSQGLWWQNNKTLFTRALAVTPDNPKAMLDLAGGMMDDGENQKALPLLQRALELEPDSGGVLFALGRIAWMQHDDAAAEDYLTRAVKAPRPTYDMWLHLASIHLHHGQFQAAQEDVRQAALLNPAGAGVHVAGGMVLLNEDDAAGAIHEFQEELRNHPQSEPALAGIAQAEARLGR